MFENFTCSSTANNFLFIFMKQIIETHSKVIIETDNIPPEEWTGGLIWLARHDILCRRCRHVC